MADGVTSSTNAPNQTANSGATPPEDTARSEFGEALKQEAEEATQMCSATAINSEEDVATFETSHAFFDVGKQLQTGELKAKSQGGKELPPPTGEQLQKLAGKSEQANRLAKEYSAKQGVEAGHVVKDNIQARSQAAADGLKETPHFGEASQKLIPEVGFKDGKIISVGKNPGGEPRGARTADLGVANKPTPPSKWNELVGQKGPEALKSTMDVKGGNAYVSDKAGFKTQSGGLEVKEVRPFTKGLKPSELGGSNESNVSAPKAPTPTPGGPPKSVHMTPLDADVHPATGKVVPGPNTDAALKRRAQVGQKGAAEAVTAQKGLAPKAPAPELLKTASLPQAAHTEQAATTVGQGFKAENTSSQAAKLEQAGAAKAESTAAKVLGGAGKVAGTVVHGVGIYATAGGTYAALKGVGDDIREGNFGSAALGTSAYLGGAGELGAMANVALTGSQSTLLLNGARVLGAPAAVAGAAIAGVQIGTYLNDHYVNKEGAMEAGDRVAAKYGPVAGGVAAAGYAIGSAAYHAPEAVVDYAKDNLTLNPSEVDWDRTLKPWKWF